MESEAESSESSVEEEPGGRWFPLGGSRNLGHLWAMGGPFGPWGFYGDFRNGEFFPGETPVQVN